jgi:serine/threonine protein kinase
MASLLLLLLLWLLLLQVNNLREIQALRRLSPHPHIIQLLEVLYDQPTGRLALVFELMVSLAWLACL